MFREDEPMPLTSGEFAVLKALVSHPREPLSRDKLMNLARGREYSAMERSIDVQISRLRRMVEEDPAHPRYIAFFSVNRESMAFSPLSPRIPAGKTFSA